MKTTIEWLDEAKAKHDLSDYALAPLLGVGRGQISRYRNGHDYLSDEAAIKLAELLGMKSPRAIIASAHAERAKSDDVRKFWERWAGVAASVMLGLSLTAMAPKDAMAGIGGNGR